MNEILVECREMIADLCDDHNVPYPIELLAKISMALGERYGND